MSGTSLVPAEASRLHELEAVVAAGIRTFHQVGRALLEIRDSRLYRADIRTFDAYCRSKWNFSRQHAYRLIDAAGVVDDCSTTGPPLEVAAQARAMVPLSPEQRREVWEAANAGESKPTAKRLRTLTERAMAALAGEEQQLDPGNPVRRPWLTPERRQLDDGIRLLGKAKTALAAVGPEATPAVEMITGAAELLEQLAELGQSVA
jgi:hypothetical protein